VAWDLLFPVEGSAYATVVCVGVAVACGALVGFELLRRRRELRL
jgi:hypothetical protein